MKTAADPDGGPFPAYPSGKSWDEASGKTGSGKKFYHNVISRVDFATQPYYVAIITPMIHYCMGGLKIDENSAVLGSDSKPVPGLYAEEEVGRNVSSQHRVGKLWKRRVAGQVDVLWWQFNESNKRNQRSEH